MQPQYFCKMCIRDRASTVGEATRQAEVSRSAFYKYKDMVMPFNNMRSGRILTFYTLLKDKPGVLSTVLAIFAASGANILTINQSIPTNGCAAVTISAETSEDVYKRQVQIKSSLHFTRSMQSAM